MLDSCHSCPGFVPPGSSTCPHCGACLGRGGSLAEKAVKLATAASMMVTLMACYGAPGGFEECGIDFVCPPGTQCDEFGSCVAVGAEDCFNGFDDDGDGLVDEEDDSCTEPNIESACMDGLDDDADGLIDCEDPDCEAFTFCLEDCGNGLDDDADGFIDCADVDSCNVCSATETECGNLFDDDQDGFTDCDDSDCTAVCAPPTCGDGLIAGTEECDDGNAVTGDGCTPECVVELEVLCPTVPVLALGENTGSNVGATNAFSATCVTTGGGERLYAFTAPADGTLYVSLQAQHDMGIYVLDACGEAAVELACANAFLGGLQETTSVPVTQGQTVLVVADGEGPNAGGDFVITASFVDTN